MAEGVIFYSDTLSPNLVRFGPAVDSAVSETVDFFTPRVEGYARSNAPWTDQTGNARNGLFAVSGHTPEVEHHIDIAHSVPYGIWLEVRFSGKYAIILPTVKSQGSELMALLKTVFARLKLSAV